MSYSRSYRETITVHGSKTVTVSYPASQSGGSTTATVHYTEHVPVNVNIHVDTNPFDQSVRGCNTNVNLLTGAVVATEAAQIASIDRNAKKVAGTIIEGFFKNVRFEITAQITELTQKIEAHLMHLHESAKQLNSKRKQMETDYNRTSNRYVKIFDDLNNELANRIFELNRPAFTFKEKIDEHSSRIAESDLVNTVAVFGSEGAGLQAQISASIAKKRTLDAINQTNTFLLKQKKLEHTINRNMLNENVSSIRYVPVCCFETDGDQVESHIYCSVPLTKAQSTKLVDRIESKTWKNAIPKDDQENIQRYFNIELNNAYAAADSHADRVKETIIKMFNFHSIKNIEA